jgi:hypothetical protein
MRNFNLISILFSITIFITTSWNAAAQIEVTATGGDVGPTAYTTLKLAFDAINAGTHTGTINIAVIGNTSETAPAVLNASGVGSASYTSIMIQPSGGAARTITGAIVAGSPLIDFNGADNVTINGLNSGGNSLTISNTTVSATSGTSTIRFINGATNNILTNCTILGAFNNTTITTNGGTIFFSTDGSTANGNDDNTISNCSIGPVGTNFPVKAIYGNGSTTTTAVGNSGIIIDNNDIFDFFLANGTSAGIYTNSGCNTWSITNNRFYQTNTKLFTGAATNSAININGTTATHGAQAFTITGNIIGYSANDQTGVYNLTGSTGKFVGIRFNGITGGTVSNINNNTIASVSLTGVTSNGTGTSSPFTAILINSGLANTNNNTIGSQSATGSLVFSTNTTASTDVNGIYNFSLDDWTSNSNSIGGISVTNAAASGTFIIYGLRANTSTSKTWTASSNIIGGTVANSIQLSATGASSQVVGMVTNNAAATFTSNTIRNMTTNIGTGTTTAASMIGMMSTTTSTNHTFSQNIIHTLHNLNTSAATVVTGIQFTGGSANIVERNLIYNLTSATNSTTAEINGIRIGGGTTTYRNNMIALGAGVSNAIGGAPSNSSVSGIVGINEFLGINNIWHNSIYIGGTATAGSGASFAFNGVQTVSTRSFRDNIFFNARTNSGGTGSHYAVKINGIAPNPPGLTINNNIYYTTGTGGVFGFFNSADVPNLTAWQTAVGQDAGSIFGDPAYNDPTASTPDLHIHPTNPSVAESNGFDVGVTNDFDGETRSMLTPVDIGADAGNFTLVDFFPPTITYTPLPFTCSTSSRTLTASITDPSGVPVSGIGLPVLYWRINAGPWMPATGVHTGGSNYDFTFGAGVTAGDVVQYYVVAQDLAATPNVGAFPAGAAGFTADPPAAAVPPATPSSYTINTTLSGSYDVGASGTYLTLTAAVNAYNTSCLTGPVIFNLIDPLYNTGSGEIFPIDILQNPFASAVNTLTIKPAPSVTAAIVGSVASNPLIFIRNNFTTIDGSNTIAGTTRDLSIENTNTTTPQVIRFVSAGTTPVNNSRIMNCIVTNGVNTSSAILANANDGSAGYFNNITIQNNDIRKAFTGIFCNAVVASGNGSGLLIQDNVLNSTGVNAIRNVGIYVQGVDGATVANNNIGNLNGTDAENDRGIWLATGTINSTVSNNIVNNLVNTSTTGSPIGINITTTTAASNNIVSNNTITQLASPSTTTVSGISVTGATGGVSIYNNIVRNIKNTNTGGWGANGIQLTSTLTAANVTVYNNFVSDVAAYGFDGGGISDNGYGIIINGGAGYTVYYNTVHMNTNQTVSGRPAAFNVTSDVTLAGAINLRNNLFINTQTVGTNRYAIYSGATSSVFSNINFNDYWSSGPNLGFIGSNRATLADIVTGFGGNANSVSILPIFVSPTDLHLVPASNAALNNLGTPITGITTDIDGDMRNATTPDMGADEFEPPVCSGAMAGTASASPAGPFCGSGSTTISSTGYSTGINTTYLWQSASDMAFTTPTDIGMPSTAYSNLSTGTITTTTYYRLKVACSSDMSEDFSNVVAVVINPLPSATINYPGTPYCKTGSASVVQTGTPGGSYTASPVGLVINSSTGEIDLGASATGTYTVTYSFTDGTCPNTTTATVSINPLPSPITFTPDPVYRCTGDVTTQIMANGGTIGGTGFPVAFSGTNALDGNPYRSFWDGGKLQFIYTAAELSAAGLFAGAPITAIAFEVTSVGDPLVNFTIQMKHTPNNTFTTTTMETGLTTVFTTPSYTPVSGLNTHTFSTPFIWNGTDNIVFNTCFGIGTTSSSSTVRVVPTIASRSLQSASDVTSCATTTGTIHGVRPFIRLTYNAPTDITWTPVTALFTDPGATTPYISGTPTATVYTNTPTMITYTATATSASGCTSTADVVVNIALSPDTPTLVADENPACPGNTVTFTAGNGSQYEFFVNAVSQGPPSRTNTYSSATLMHGDVVKVTSYSPFTIDGNITETKWGGALATSAGGPAPGFGINHEINALYLQADQHNINIGLAGNVVDGNRILLFIDSKTGGYVDGNFGRAGAPPGVSNFNSGTLFDAGFLPDYCLVIGTNMAGDNNFFNLYTLTGTAVPSVGGGPDTYLGDRFTSFAGAVTGANPLSADLTRGFEVVIPKGLLGYTGGPLTVMAMYISDGGFLSNQFLTRANPGDGNYGGGAVDFNLAAPNPVNIPLSNLQSNCTASAEVTMEIQTGLVVKNSGNSGLNSLRKIVECAPDGSTITYDQPMTTQSLLTAPLTIDKNLTIQGAGPTDRPEITVPSTGITITSTKVLTLENVDIKSTGSAAFSGMGTVIIEGTTEGKN